MSSNERPVDAGREFEARWRDRFESFAEANEDDAGIAGWSPTGLQTRLRAFVNAWEGDRVGNRWLDAGCGAGSYSRYLAGRELDVIGLDYSQPTIVKARARGADPAAPSLCWGVADATRLPLRDAEVDGVLSFGVTQALAESGRLLGELTRVVKPGGQLWVDGLNRWCAPHLIEIALRRLRGQPDHLRYEAPYRLARTLRRLGMREVRVHWLVILPGRFARWQSWVEGVAFQTLLRALPPLALLLAHSFMLSARKPEAA